MSTPSTTKPVESSGPFPMAPPHHKQLLYAWAGFWLVALIVKGGVEPALRGAFVGADSIIESTEHIGDFLSQVAALATTILLVVAGLGGLRIDTRLLLRIFNALLVSLPTAIVFLAQRTTLPHFATGLAAACAGGSLLLGTWLAKLDRSTTRSLLLCGLSVTARAASELLKAGSSTEGASEPLLQVAHVLALTATINAFLPSVLLSPKRLALSLGLGALLGQASGHSGSIHSTPLLVLARTLNAVTTHPSSLSAGLFVALLSLSVVCARRFLSRCARLLLVCVLLASHAQLTPLVASAFALCGVFLPFIYGVDTPQPLSPNRPHLVGR